jgi:hypothetical protein
LIFNKLIWSDKLFIDKLFIAPKNPYQVGP